jgi:BirA family biotin operon repressor/biotin-[acetyl-CoA-carboxylase] ligase
MLDLSWLDAALAGTDFAGKLHYRAVTGSTNADAIEAARAGAAHGSVFLADAQNSGRGRGDHAWHAPAGEGLYVSVLLRLDLPATRLLFLPMAVGLAVCNAIEELSGCKADLRWPNDVLIGERKIVGILVEAKSGERGNHFAVAGVGINVHQREFPAGMATPATSLDLETGRRISRQELLVALLKSLQRETAALALPDAAAAIPRRIEAVSSWVRGRAVEVHGPQACHGVTAGLDENGFLLVQTSEGIVRVQTGGIRDLEKKG